MLLLKEWPAKASTCMRTPSNTRGSVAQSIWYAQSQGNATSNSLTPSVPVCHSHCILQSACLHTKDLQHMHDAHSTRKKGPRPVPAHLQLLHGRKPVGKFTRQAALAWVSH
jgi:hypothetical protein